MVHCHHEGIRYLTNIKDIGFFKFWILWVCIRDMNCPIGAKRCIVSGIIYGFELNPTHHPTLPKQLSVNVRFWLAKIVCASSCCHENTGWWIRLYSVSYVSKTDRSPSCKAFCAGSIVESSKAKWTKSIGIVDTFSSVILIVDLSGKSDFHTHT